MIPLHFLLYFYDSLLHFSRRFTFQFPEVSDRNPVQIFTVLPRSLFTTESDISASSVCPVTGFDH